MVAEIAVSSGPIGGIAATADGQRLLVSNCRGDSVSLIDTRNCAVLQTITGTPEPFAIALPVGANNRAYVTTATAPYDAIAVVDMRAKMVVATYPLAFSVTDLAVSADGNRLYASRTEPGLCDIAVLDPTTGDLDVIEIATEPGTTAEHVCISSDAQRLYVAVNGPYDGRLVVIDTVERHITHRIEIGSPIRDVALSPDGGTAYVASCGTDFGTAVDVIDSRTSMVVSTAKVGASGGFVTQLALSGDGDRGYLVGDGGVTVLSLPARQVIGTIPTNTPPSCVIESPDGTWLYVADYAGVVTVVSVASLLVGEVGEEHDDITCGLPALRTLEPALI